MIKKSCQLSLDIIRSAFFFKVLLKIWTARSANPFVAGCYGAEVRCLIPLRLIKTQNSSLVKTLPLSETRISGKPNVANIVRKAEIVLLDVAEHTGCTSIHLEWASIKYQEHLSHEWPSITYVNPGPRTIWPFSQM